MESVFPCGRKVSFSVIKLAFLLANQKPRVMAQESNKLEVAIFWQWEQFWRGNRNFVEQRNLDFDLVSIAVAFCCFARRKLTKISQIVYHDKSYSFETDFGWFIRFIGKKTHLNQNILFVKQSTKLCWAYSA